MDVESIAPLLAHALGRMLAVQETATVAVSPGPVLLAVLSALATRDLPWDRLRFLMVDELRVPPSDPRSRYRAVYDAFFSRIPLRPGHALRYWSEGDPPEAVADYYGQMASEVLELPQGDLPRLDVVLLEADEDGTVGAFVPGSAALAEGGGFARTVEVAGALHYTLTGDSIRRARRVFVVGPGRLDDSPVVAALRPVDGELVCLEVSETGSSGPASHP